MREEHQILSNLMYNIKSTLEMEGLTNTDRLNFISSDLSNVITDLGNYNLTASKTVLEDVKMRIERLVNVKKQHKVMPRVEEILEEINW